MPLRLRPKQKLLGAPGLPLKDRERLAKANFHTRSAVRAIKDPIGNGNAGFGPRPHRAGAFRHVRLRTAVGEANDAVDMGRMP